MDDGSTDETGKLIDKCSVKHHEVKAYHKINGRVSSARNFGMEKMRGKYFEFVDADDKLIPQRIAPIIQKLSAN